MKLFFIRQKSTGLYIQHGAKGSLLPPGPDWNARVFPSLRACRGFMNNWLLGMTVPDGEYESKVVPVPSRKADDFEIIEKEIDLAASSQITHPAASPVPAQHVPHSR